MPTYLTRLNANTPAPALYISTHTVEARFSSIVCMLLPAAKAEFEELLHTMASKAFDDLRSSRPFAGRAKQFADNITMRVRHPDGLQAEARGKTSFDRDNSQNLPATHLLDPEDVPPSWIQVFLQEHMLTGHLSSEVHCVQVPPFCWYSLQWSPQPPELGQNTLHG